MGIDYQPRYGGGRARGKPVLRGTPAKFLLTVNWCANVCLLRETVLLQWAELCVLMETEWKLHFVKPRFLCPCCWQPQKNGWVLRDDRNHSVGFILSFIRCFILRFWCSIKSVYVEFCYFLCGSLTGFKNFVHWDQFNCGSILYRSKCFETFDYECCRSLEECNVKFIKKNTIRCWKNTCVWDVFTYVIRSRSYRIWVFA